MLTPLFAENVTHQVERGETLYSISKKYAVSVDSLIHWNNIANPGELNIGKQIIIPDVYQVSPGDTLFSISRLFDVSIDDLKEANELEGNFIKQDDILVIPGAGAISRAGSKSNPKSVEAVVTEEVHSTKAVQASDNTEERKNRKSISLQQNINAGMPLPVEGEVSKRAGKFPGFVIHSKLGTPVQAVQEGTVIYAGPHSSFGNVVFIQSSNNYIYVYAYQADISVKVGERIKQGDSIGTVGVSPEVNTPALYFSIWKDSRFVDTQYIQ